MDKNQYDFANLSNTDLQQISMLEKTLSKEKGEEVILIAYQDQDHHDESRSFVTQGCITKDGRILIRLRITLMQLRINEEKNRGNLYNK